MQVSKFIYLVSLSDLPNIESVNSSITSHQHESHTGMLETLEKRGIKSQGGEPTSLSLMFQKKII